MHARAVAAGLMAVRTVYVEVRACAFLERRPFAVDARHRGERAALPRPAHRPEALETIDLIHAVVVSIELRDGEAPRHADLRVVAAHALRRPREMPHTVFCNLRGHGLRQRNRFAPVRVPTVVERIPAPVVAAREHLRLDRPAVE
jgi:hypothetical protein